MSTPAKTTRTTSKASRSTDADTARDLLTWCRRQGVHVQRVRVGDVELDGIADLTRVAGGALSDTPPANAPSDIRRQFGGEAIDRLHRQQGDGPDGSLQIVEEDD